ncbi:MAG: glycosyltransferase family 1 protein [Acidobacteriota bacterium]|nr:glycosyltransferase family 1 protein [Acidobacteriota bacterium]
MLTPSHFSAGEIEQRLGVPREKIHVTPLGVEANWSDEVGAAERRALRKWLGWEGPYLLHLGAVHLRRHVDVTVEAFARLATARPELRLVVAGPDQPPAPDLAGLAARLGVAGRVQRRPWVPGEHLRGLVAEARALVYLSDYEGFGLPALEAMACGTPVVALRRASLPEVLGEAAVWADRPDAEQVATVTAHLLDDELLAARLARAGRGRARDFTWQACARRTLAVLRRAARLEV